MEETMNDTVNFLKVCRINSMTPSVTERYFKPRFFTENDNCQCILVHSNRLCIVTVGPMHPIVAKGKTVIAVDFESIGNVSRLNNKVSGKFKRGGQKLKQNSPLCIVHCNDNSSYTLVSCVSGTLVEVNERLVKEPHLLSKKPWSEGYIAIILPPFESSEKQITLDLPVGLSCGANCEEIKIVD